MLYLPRQFSSSIELPSPSNCPRHQTAACAFAETGEVTIENKKAKIFYH
jgi:hypothetical protein